jgi:hypothetical protein
MASTDLKRLELAARRAYEWTRLWRALLGFLPILGLVALTALLVDRPGLVVALGAGLFGAGTVLLWYGRDLGRAVFPGVVAGLLPLCLSVGSYHDGQACLLDGSCLSLCVAACSAGGLGAGLFVAWYARKRPRSPWFWFSVAAVTLVTGALGCSCVGYAGISGLVLGYGLGVGPGMLRALRRASPGGPSDR